MKYQIKEIPSLPNYFADTSGNIWSKKSGELKKLKPYKMQVGYLIVDPSVMGKSKHKRVHRLVLEAFVGPCPEGMEACHNNHIRDDNRLENLRWDTRKNNSHDALERGTHSGLHILGEKAGASKLTDEEVVSIRKQSQYGVEQKQLAKLFNISAPAISFIVRRITWKHISTPELLDNPNL